jgi:hypothetical protein
VIKGIEAAALAKEWCAALPSVVGGNVSRERNESLLSSARCAAAVNCAAALRLFVFIVAQITSAVCSG